MLGFRGALCHIVKKNNHDNWNIKHSRGAGRERAENVKPVHFSSFIVKEKECYVSFPVFFKQHSFANIRKGTTIALMKGAKQPQAFWKESPGTAAQKESNLVQHTQMNYVSRNSFLQEVRVFFYTQKLYYKHSKKSSNWEIWKLWGKEGNLVWNTTPSSQVTSLLKVLSSFSF